MEIIPKECIQTRQPVLKRFKFTAFELVGDTATIIDSYWYDFGANSPLYLKYDITFR